MARTAETAAEAKRVRAVRMETGPFTSLLRRPTRHRLIGPQLRRDQRQPDGASAPPENAAFGVLRPLFGWLDPILSPVRWRAPPACRGFDGVAGCTDGVHGSRDRPFITESEWQRGVGTGSSGTGEGLWAKGAAAGERGGPRAGADTSRRDRDAGDSAPTSPSPGRVTAYGAIPHPEPACLARAFTVPRMAPRQSAQYVPNGIDAQISRGSSIARISLTPRPTAPYSRDAIWLRTERSFRRCGLCTVEQAPLPRRP